VLFRLLCQSAAWLVLVLFALLVAILVWRSWESIGTNGWRFFTTSTWDPEPTHRQFGALAFIWGTAVTSIIAMVLAVPLGIGTAAFLSEIAPRSIRRIGPFAVEMLAAIPSVVYGFWGLYVFVPALQSIVHALGVTDQSGTGLLPAGLVLGIMIVPYVAAVSFDVIRAVPRSQREASYALGATRWQTIWSVVLPYARPGIIGGCFLALGRALGETMAVTMLIGNVTEISPSLFAKGNSIPSVIANTFTEATYDLHLSALVQLGLLLLLVSVGFSAVGRLLIWRMGRVRKGGSPFQGLRRAFRKAIAVESGPAPAQEAAATRPRFRLSDLVGTSRGKSWIDRLMTGVLGLCLTVTIVPLILILGYLLIRGGAALDWNFFVKLPKPVGETGGGIANALYGSALMVGLATAFSVPVGLLAAIYLAEYRSDRLGPVVRFVGELLGSVPSIVIGIFGYYLVVKPITGHFSGLAGGFALGVMMVPIVMRASEEALKLVPPSLRQASYALGASQWQTVLRVTVPAAKSAIITAVFLAIARVAGETAPLLLTASTNAYWPRSVNDFTPSLPVYIFNYAISPYEDWRRQAWAAAFVLLVVIMLLNFGTRVLTGKRTILASHAD
jgi:phosphate transport system permease protein